MNATLKKTLSCQISLLEAYKRLVRAVDNFQAKLFDEKTQSMTVRPQILDLNGFATLLDKVTTYTIYFIAPEWVAACLSKPDTIWQGSCLHHCIIPLRYSLVTIRCSDLFWKAFLCLFPWFTHAGGYQKVLFLKEDGLWDTMMQL